MSSYLVASYLGISVPVIGVGVLAAFFSTMVAHVVFAAVIAAFAATAFWAGIRYVPQN